MPYIMRDEANNIVGLLSWAAVNGETLDEFKPDDDAEVIAFRQKMADEAAQ
jgi:hypothetical protein